MTVSISQFLTSSDISTISRLWIKPLCMRIFCKDYTIHLETYKYKYKIICTLSSFFFFARESVFTVYELVSLSSLPDDPTVQGLDKSRHLQTGEMIIIVVVLVMWAGTIVDNVNNNVSFRRADIILQCLCLSKDCISRYDTTFWYHIFLKFIWEFPIPMHHSQFGII